MKKTLIVIALFMMTLTQCRKPVLIGGGMHGEKQNISFTTNGDGDEKGNFIEDGNIKYQWNKKDVLFVYGIDNAKHGIGYAGVLITSEDNISSDKYTATFEGEVEIPEGTYYLRFIHFGNESNVTTSGDNIGAANIDFSTQNGNLNDISSSLSKIVVSYTDIVYVQNQKKYSSGTLNTCFAIARFDFTDYASYSTDISLAGVPYNKIQVTKEGDINFVSSSSPNITLVGAAGKSSYNIAIPFDSPVDGAEFTLDFTGGDYSTIGSKNFKSNKFYYGSSSKDAAGIMVKRQCVDLGLPSGKRWMLWNVGAANDNPKSPGNQYQWGSKTAYTGSTSTWANYCWGNGEAFSESNKDIFKKYHADLDAYVASGFTKDKYEKLVVSNIDAENDDVARKELGKSWSIPSKEDFYELISNCYWEVYSDDGGTNWYYIVYKTLNDSDKGCWKCFSGQSTSVLVTKKNGSVVTDLVGYSSSVTNIIIPAKSGITSSKGYNDNYGSYWTSNIAWNSTYNRFAPESANNLLFNHYNCLAISSSYRYAAYTIRAVTDAPSSEGNGSASSFGSGTW